MNQYRASDGDRLDIVIFKAYGTIDNDVTQAVLDENEHLLNSPVLKSGDVVFLPEIQTVQEESSSQALWS